MASTATNNGAAPAPIDSAAQPPPSFSMFGASTFPSSVVASGVLGYNMTPLAVTPITPGMYPALSQNFPGSPQSMAYTAGLPNVMYSAPAAHLPLPSLPLHIPGLVQGSNAIAYRLTLEPVLHSLEATKLAEAIHLVEEAGKAQETQLALLAERLIRAEDAIRKQEARLADEVRKMQKAREADESRRAEETHQAEEGQRAEEARLAAVEASLSPPVEISVAPALSPIEVKREIIAQARIRQLGKCAQGYDWIKQADGYRCAGGAHFATNAELGI